MNKHILIFLAILATKASCTTDERLLDAQLKHTTAIQSSGYVASALKGAATAALYTTWTAGGYSVYAGYTFGSLLAKRLAQNKSQSERQRDVSLAELINSGCQAAVSTALALALWGVLGENKITKARDAVLGTVLECVNPFRLTSEQRRLLFIHPGVDTNQYEKSGLLAVPGANPLLTTSEFFDSPVDHLKAMIKKNPGALQAMGSQLMSGSLPSSASVPADSIENQNKRQNFLRFIGLSPNEQRQEQLSWCRKAIDDPRASQQDKAEAEAMLADPSLLDREMGALQLLKQNPVMLKMYVDVVFGAETSNSTQPSASIVELQKPTESNSSSANSDAALGAVVSMDYASQACDEALSQEERSAACAIIGDSNLFDKKEEKEQEDVLTPKDIMCPNTQSTALDSQSRDEQGSFADSTSADLEEKFNKLLQASPEQLKEYMLEEAMWACNDPNLSSTDRQAVQWTINNHWVLDCVVNEMYHDLRTNPQAVRLAMMQQENAKAHSSMQQPMPSEDELIRAFNEAKRKHKTDAKSNNSVHTKQEPLQPAGLPKFPVTQEAVNKIGPNYGYTYEPSCQWNNITAPYVVLGQEIAKRSTSACCEPKSIQFENKVAIIESCDDEDSV